MKKNKRVVVEINAFLNLGTRRRRVISFSPGEKEPGTQRTGGWVSPRAVCEMRRTEKSLPCKESNLDSPVVRSVA
jgi:hypothetical protein